MLNQTGLGMLLMGWVLGTISATGCSPLRELADDVREHRSHITRTTSEASPVDLTTPGPSEMCIHISDKRCGSAALGFFRACNKTSET
jgi:hypothetical protein